MHSPAVFFQLSTSHAYVSSSSVAEYSPKSDARVREEVREPLVDLDGDLCEPAPRPPERRHLRHGHPRPDVRRHDDRPVCASRTSSIAPFGHAVGAPTAASRDHEERGSPPASRAAHGARPPAGGTAHPGDATGRTRHRTTTNAAATRAPVRRTSPPKPRVIRCRTADRPSDTPSARLGRLAPSSASGSASDVSSASRSACPRASASVSGLCRRGVGVAPARPVARRTARRRPGVPRDVAAAVGLGVINTRGVDGPRFSVELLIVGKVLLHPRVDEPERLLVALLDPGVGRADAVAVASPTASPPWTT